MRRPSRSTCSSPTRQGEPPPRLSLQALVLNRQPLARRWTYEGVEDTDKLMAHLDLLAPYKPAAGLESITKMPLVYGAGERWNYGISNDWLALVVEAVSGQTLEAYEQQHIFAPLGIKDTSFVPNPLRISMPHGPKAPGDPFTFSAEGESFPASVRGGAGLSGSPRSYLALLRMLLRGGLAPDGVSRILQEATVDRMFAPQLQTDRQRADCAQWTVWGADPFLRKRGAPFPGSDYGYGGLLTGEGYPSGRGRGAMSWSGYANTFWVVDRERDVAFGESRRLRSMRPVAPGSRADMVDLFLRMTRSRVLPEPAVWSAECL